MLPVWREDLMIPPMVVLRHFVADLPTMFTNMLRFDNVIKM